MQQNSYIMLVVAFAVPFVTTQRSPYAGFRPIGYPELTDKIQPQESINLGNKFGDPNDPFIPVTTQRLPIDAQGDIELVNLISSWPKEKQPYWYLNWKQIEAHRQNPPVHPVNTKPSFGSNLP